jgi:hypothetical protein
MASFVWANPELLRQFRAFTEAMNNCHDVDMRYVWKLKRDDVVRRAKQQETINYAQ